MRSRKKYFKTGTKQKYTKYYAPDPRRREFTLSYTVPSAFLPLVLTGILILLCTYLLQSISLPHISLPTIALPQLSLPHFTIPKVTFVVRFPSLSLPDISLPQVPQVSLPQFPEIHLPSISIRDGMSSTFLSIVNVITSVFSAFFSACITVFQTIERILYQFLLLITSAYLSFIAVCSAAFTTMVTIIYRFLLLINPLPYILAFGQTLIEIFKFVFETALSGILWILHVLDPRPLFHLIGKEIAYGLSVCQFYLNLASPYIQLVWNSCKQTTSDLRENTKTLLAIFQYLMKTSSH